METKSPQREEKFLDFMVKSEKRMLTLKDVKF
jgi:hypothetical protein